MRSKTVSIILTAVMAMSLSACGVKPAEQTPAQETEAVSEQPDATAESGEEDKTATEEAPAETSDLPEEGSAQHAGEVMILCTSDVHSGVDQGFGYAGLYEIKENLKSQGYEVILIDDGDSIQGEALATLTKGESNIKLMNAVGYDVVIPGNHEFDYGTERFLELADMADFKYISCNFNREGEFVFDPYTIIEKAGIKFGFVGVTTPESLVSSNPANFQDETGKTIYGFMQDDNGSGVYEAVQSAVDAARADGADYVCVMGHMGLEETAKPWTYADVISHTNGIDVFFDGHSHDTEQIVMKNKDGEDVYRCAVGTKMHCIGHSLITSEGMQDTGLWSWPNDMSAPEMIGIDNPVGDAVNEELKNLEEVLNQPVTKLDYDLVDSDPTLKDLSGNPLRLVRLTETNLGDLCADAYREATGTDIAIINGGGIRAGIKKGDVTYGDIIAVFPFGNTLTVVEATGQQILDALEWGSRGVPQENGGFLHVSGMTYEIDSTIDSPCTAADDGSMTGISGQRRVKNVMIGSEPIDPSATYTVTGTKFTLVDCGDGFTVFQGCEVIQPEAGLDNQVLIDYMIKIREDGRDSLYTDPEGEGRIVITE